MRGKCGAGFGLLLLVLSACPVLEPPNDAASSRNGTPSDAGNSADLATAMDRAAALSDLASATNDSTASAADANVADTAAGDLATETDHATPDNSSSAYPPDAQTATDLVTPGGDAASADLFQALDATTAGDQPGPALDSSRPYPDLDAGLSDPVDKGVNASVDSGLGVPGEAGSRPQVDAGMSVPDALVHDLSTPCDAAASRDLAPGADTTHVDTWTDSEVAGLDAGSTTDAEHPDAGVSTDAGPVQTGPPFSRVALQYPIRLALAQDGTLYVSDSAAGRVVGDRAGAVVLDLQGLNKPLGLAVSGDLLFVGSDATDTVEVFDRHLGLYQYALGIGYGEVAMPNDIAVTPDGNLVFVADSRANQVRVYSRDGLRLPVVGSRGSGNGQFRFPTAVAADDSRLVVGDQGNNRVQFFDLAGRWQRSVGRPPPSSSTTLEDFVGTFSSIQAIALQGSDVAVLDSTFGHVQLFAGDDAVIGFIGRRGAGADVALPLGLAWTAMGAQLVVTDPDRHRVVVYPYQPRALP